VAGRAARGAYRKCAGTCPVAKRLEAQTLALPLHNRMTAEDLDDVVEQLRRI
jgi:dTDP-4-amino-4,6-dideoxygalactose transaminase